MVLQGETEAELRKQLGIAENAEKILVFTETSHWDPNWLLTSEEYFLLRVKRQLIKAIDELLKEPRRVYGVECVFFLKMLYERVPELRQNISMLINEGRLRMMGVGITTPDTILPPLEALIRDYLLGSSWLKKNFNYENHYTAFLPDSFGFSPAIVDVFTHLGFTAMALCRLDGMYFLGNETELPYVFPRKNSTAYRLLREEKTLDFFFKSPNGNEILTHWLAYTYGQGELLTHIGITRLLGLPLAIYCPAKPVVAKRIEKYSAQLAKFTKSPYMLCPIGFDFSYPIKNLVDHLDAYNESYFDKTGVWAVNLGLDDYFRLQSFHKEKFPVIELDPVQYFTGFFSSRMDLKSIYYKLVDKLIATEAKLVENFLDSEIWELKSELEKLWWSVAFANHHDYITGTSPDRVVRKEQMPVIENALSELDNITEQISAVGEKKVTLFDDQSNTLRKSSKSTHHVREVSDRRLKLISNGFNEIYLNDDLVISRFLRIDLFEDSGGLWRMGNEYKGGVFKRINYLDLQSLNTHVADKNYTYEFSGELEGKPIYSYATVDNANKAIHVTTSSQINHRRTLLMDLRFPFFIKEIYADTQTSLIKRENEPIFKPTFWPFQHLIVLRGIEQKKLKEIIIAAPFGTAYSVNPGDETSLKIIIARNASQEIAYNLVPLPAFPARGHVDGKIRYNFSLFIKEGVDDHFNYLELVEISKVVAREANNEYVMNSVNKMFSLKAKNGLITAVKPSISGNGVIMRVLNFADKPTVAEVKCFKFDVSNAYVVDGMEKEITELTVRKDTIITRLNPGINSIKLYLDKN